MLSIVLVCSGGGLAAHTISDLETGHEVHSRLNVVAVLAASSLVFLAGMFPLLSTRG